MQAQECDVQTLKEAHRRSAERVRNLLEELEVAEQEFARLTEALRAVSDPGRNDYTPMALR